MFESKAGVLFVGGLGFFVFAFISNALVPIFMFQDIEEQHVLEYVTAGEDDVVVDDDGVWYLRMEKPRPDAVAPPWLAEGDEGFWLERLGLPEAETKLPRRVTEDKNGNYKIARGLAANNSRVMTQFEDLSRRYAEPFEEHFGKPTYENLEEALLLGRQVYVGEGCWHCHSQFIRPVSNESRRWGDVSETWEYQNELQRPVMFGTRRVGPDLSREGGRRSNDWHAVHFFEPTLVSTDSPMPSYPWLFDGSPDKPNRRGIALITYIQWLGSWLDSYPYYEQLDELNEEEFE